MRKRVLSLILSICMLLSLLPAEVFAVYDLPCSHHTEHTAGCGYSDPVLPVPCGHTCDENCYSTAHSCLHSAHEESCGGLEDETLCTHVCSEESGCVSRSQDCRHVHDGSCGYAEGREGRPCTFQCQECVDEEKAELQGEPVEAANELTEAANEPTEAADQSTGITDKSTETADQSTEAANQSTEAADQSTGAADQSTEAADQSTGAADQSTGAADQSTEAADKSTEAAGQSAEIADESTEESVLLSVEETIPAETSNIAYLSTGMLWDASLYDYAVWAWPNGGSGQWIVPAGETDADGWTPFHVGDNPNVIFVAIRKGQATDWNNKVYQTIDLKYDPAKPYFTLAAETESNGNFKGSWEASDCSHVWHTEITEEPSCTVAGVKTYTCSQCGTSYTETLAIVDHTLDSNGVCTVCGSVPGMVFASYTHLFPEGEYDCYAWLWPDGGDGRWVSPSSIQAVDGYTAFQVEENDDNVIFLIVPEGMEASWNNRVIQTRDVSFADTPYITLHGRYSMLPVGVENNIDTYVAAEPCAHSWSESETGTDCTTDGSKVWDCANCDASANLVIRATGHSAVPEDMTVVTPATCTTEGEGSYLCENCQKTVAVSIPATGHKYVYERDVLPTCTADGVKINRCEYCQEEKLGDVIPATGHSPAPENMTIITPATCTTEGEGSYLCENCQKTVAVSIPAAGHKYVYVRDELPTCTADGFKMNRCEYCQEEKQGDAIPATGHSAVPEDMTVIIPPTCTAEGEGSYLCENCQQTVSVIIPTAGHTYEPDEVIISPTCTTDGGQLYLCTNPDCTEQYVNPLPALGHDIDEDHICKNCNTEATILLTAADGSTAYYISMTSAMLDANDIPGGAIIQLLKDTTWLEERNNLNYLLSDTQGSVVLDLNGFTLTCDLRSVYQYGNAQFTVKNGSLYVQDAVYMFRLQNCRFTMENVTVTGRDNVFTHLIVGLGAENSINLTGVVLECNSGNGALLVDGGTAELTECVFYTGREEADGDKNSIYVNSYATLRINSGRYKRIYSIIQERSVYEFINTGTHDYRHFDGYYCYQDGYSLGREVCDVDVVPVPFKIEGATESLDAQMGHPVTLVPEYTPNAEDFEPEDLEIKWTFWGIEPPHTVHEDNSITITPNKETVTVICHYMYRSYRITKTFEINVTDCTEHSYDEQGLCIYCDSYEPAEDTNADGYLEITNPGNLWWFSQQVNDGQTALNAVLTANIDLSSTCGEGTGNWQPISNKYRGHFNGQNHTISDLYMTGEEQYVGLFGYVRGATIENVKVSGSVSSTFDLDGATNKEGTAGGIVARLGSGTIRNCRVDMTVSGELYTGGICGQMDGGRIEGCTVNGAVIFLGNGDWNGEVGGIVGGKVDGSIQGCINQAGISAGYWSSLGGIAGGNYGGTIENCLNQGAVTGRNTSNLDAAGGIVGDNKAVIRSCGNQGTITTACKGNWVGGIVGGNLYGEAVLENCYNVGTVTAAGDPADPVCGTSDGVGILQNIYYISDTATEDGGRTADQFTSGQVTYELNGSVTADTNVWRQTIGTDRYPVFAGPLVYYGESFICDGASTGIFYHNQEPNTSVPPHEINRDTGICAGCGQRIGYLRINAEGIEDYAMTLSEAAAIAGTRTAVITLLDNMGSAEAPAADFGSISCGQLTFDLNGRTLLYNGYPFVSVTSGRLTVTGTGTIQRSTNQAVRFVADGGSVRLQGGTYPNGLASSYTAIRYLLDEGYLFKTDGGWQAYDLAAGSFGSTVSVSVLPAPVIISEVPKSDVGIIRGEKRSLSVTAVPRNPADTITYEWIAGDITGTEAEFDLSVLPARTYSLKLTIRCGDVPVYVQYISLTVYPCLHEDAPNGFCKFCGYYVPAELKDGVYQIANGGNLFWFAAMVNGDSTHADFDAQDKGADAVLTADIDLENREWIPVRKYEFASFDGQGHSISGFSMTTTENAGDHSYHGRMLGLFGWIDSCTIRNFTLNGSMNITEGGMTGNGRLGTVVGVSDRDSVISGITSNVEAKIAYEVAYAGGIVGGHYNGAVSQCIFTGLLKLDGTFREAGGIAGYVGSGSFDNCAFYGLITNAGIHAGGIIGYTNSGGTHVRSCCVFGAMDVNYNKEVGAIIGCADNCGEVENNYFGYQWDIENAFGQSSSFTFSETAAYAKPDTDFLSGEVAWLLNGSKDNGIWKQTIDGWNCCPDFTGLPVYRWTVYDCGEHVTGYSYANEAGAHPVPEHQVDDQGQCQVCGTLFVVDITWGDLSFTYTDGTWNPDSLTYEGGGWMTDTENGNVITVSNTSNEALTVSASYTPAADYTGISGSFAEMSAVLAEDEEKQFCLLLSGKPESEISGATIGTVTVRIGGE